MKFTVIIPTRERAGTLGATIKTCVSQDYDDLTILISDNHSSDETANVVQSFSDSRIKYINTGKRLSMTGNWDFALSHVEEGYFTFIGDDDGLMPNAVNDVSNVIRNLATKGLTWNKIEYHWPDHPTRPDYMCVQLSNSITQSQSRKVLRDILNGWQSYNRGPCFYNSFIHVDVAHAMRAKTNKFLGCSSPDVYSAIAACSVLDDFWYSTRPFSVNGASGNSNGTSLWLKERGKEGIRFLEEMDFDQKRIVGLFKNSFNYSLLENYFDALTGCFDDKLKIWEPYWLFLIGRDLFAGGDSKYESADDDFFKLCSQLNRKWMFPVVKKLCRKIKISNNVQGKSHGLGLRNWLNLDTRNFQIKDVFDACQVAHFLLGPYRFPEKIWRYSLPRIFAKSFVRRVNDMFPGP